MVDNIVIFDRDRVRRNRDRSLPRLSEHGFLLDWTADQISDRLRDVTKDFPVGVLMGLRGDLAEKLKDTGKIGTLIGMDFAETTVKTASGFRVIGDEEYLPFGNHSLDLAVSALGLHTTNDLPGALIQIRRALKPDGLFLGALFGGESLMELRQSLTAAEIELKGGISPRVFPFADKPEMGNLMQRAGFALPVIDSEIVTVTYPDMFALLKDLRFMGEGNSISARDKKFVGKKFFDRAADLYKKNFSEPDGRIRASFEIIFLIGWSPHASQQQPLAPGSAKARLADALQTTEIKTKM
jgi:NADH dehydrogenase [ubiquinone] 1 alpha subcomplex assembly factor 5